MVATGPEAMVARWSGRGQPERRFRPREGFRLAVVASVAEGFQNWAVSVAWQSLLPGQLEHVDGVSVVRMPDLRRDGARHLPGAPTAQAGGDCDVLPAVRAKRHRESLYG